MISRLAARLAGLAARKELISYGALARDIDLPSPGTIAQLTTALEALMAEDAAGGRPFRAALCRTKLNDLPALGFFVKANELGRYSGPVTGPEAAAFVHDQRAGLFNRPPQD